MKKRVIISICLFLILSALFTVAAAASPPFPPEIERARNYQFTTVFYESGTFDLIGHAERGISSIIADFANSLFQLIASLGWSVIKLFELAMGENLPYKFSGLKTVLEALNNSIFTPLLVLGYAMGFFLMAKQFLKNNMQGMAIEFFKIIFVVVLSVFVTTNAQATLSRMTDTSKGIGMTALLDTANPTGTSTYTQGNYTERVSDMLWADLVYEPWKIVQFWGYSGVVDDNTASLFVNFRHSYSPSNTYFGVNSSGGWTNIPGDFVENNPSSFGTDINAGRIGIILAYSIPFVIKCLLYLLVAALLLFYQFMAIIFTLLAPLVLILSLFPIFGGFEILKRWFRKLAETQVMIIVISFLLGLIIRSSEFFTIGTGAGGQIASMFLQAAVTIAVIWKHNALLAFLGIQGASMAAGAGALISRGARNVQSHVRHRRIERNMQRSSRVFAKANTATANTVTSRINSNKKEDTAPSSTPAAQPMNGQVQQQGNETRVHNTQQPPPSAARVNNRPQTGEAAPLPNETTNINNSEQNRGAAPPPPAQTSPTQVNNEPPDRESAPLPLKSSPARMNYQQPEESAQPIISQSIREGSTRHEAPYNRPVEYETTDVQGSNTRLRAAADNHPVEYKTSPVQGNSTQNEATHIRPVEYETSLARGSGTQHEAVYNRSVEYEAIDYSKHTAHKSPALSENENRPTFRQNRQPLSTDKWQPPPPKQHRTYKPHINARQHERKSNVSAIRPSSYIKMQPHTYESTADTPNGEIRSYQAEGATS